MKFTRTLVSLFQSASLQDFKAKLQAQDFSLKWKFVQFFIEKENDFIPLIDMDQLTKRTLNLILIREQLPKGQAIQKHLFLKRNRKKKQAH